MELGRSAAVCCDGTSGITGAFFLATEAEVAGALGTASAEEVY